MVKFCSKCVMPNTKPDLSFDDNGVCNACVNFDDRSNIDWDARKKELVEIVDKFSPRDRGSNWDCIIPVSGGKDSTYQVIKILELGINPLCVTSSTCHLSDIGRRNIENIKNLGVDYVEFTPNPVVRRKLNKICLEEVGDISWPEHLLIFTIPVRASVHFNVPLIIWGENSQNEYGGPASESDNNILDRRWLEEFGGLLGLRVSDLVEYEGIKKENLIYFNYPTNEELKRVGTTGLFLGYYLPWDGISNVLISQAYGFETFPKSVETTFTSYENLDNYQAGIHDYFKFLKFGFGRGTDLACTHLRRGRITRDEAKSIVARCDGKFPWTYLGKPIEEILDYIDMSLDEFIKICDKFTNKKLFAHDGSKLSKDKDGNLIKLFTP